jgi:molecular chaperone DnaJ
MVKILNHYHTLNIDPLATQAEIKQAYRRLVKRFHPDVNQDETGHEEITRINAAYEILGDPSKRYSYDQFLSNPRREIGSQSTGVGIDDRSPAADWSGRQQRTAQAQHHYQQQRRAEPDADQQLQQWLQRVYAPVNRLLCQILMPLKEEINQLAADPFDDELMEDFQAYLEECRDRLQQAQTFFKSLPNPPSVAGIAEYLYYCVNHVSDGLDELETFTLNYDDRYLHVGQEFFRIAQKLRQEAQLVARSMPS